MGETRTYESRKRLRDPSGHHVAGTSHGTSISDRQLAKRAYELEDDSEDSEDSDDSEDSEDSEDAEDSEDSDDSEDAEDSEDSDDSDDSEDAELLLDELEEDDSGAVGLPLLQPPRAPTPARAAPPESRIRNSRLSDRRRSSAATPDSIASSFFSVITPLSGPHTGPGPAAPGHPLVRSVLECCAFRLASSVPDGEPGHSPPDSPPRVSSGATGCSGGR